MSCPRSAKPAAPPCERGPQSVIEEIANFSREMLGAPAGLFTWVAGDGYTPAEYEFGLSEGFVAEYHRSSAVRCDPLRKLKDQKTTSHVGILSHFKAHEQSSVRQSSDEYAAFLQRRGYSDNLIFLFHAGDQPIAVLGLFKESGLAFAIEDGKLESIHRLLQYALGSDARFRRLRWRAAAERQFNLTHREIEIAELILAGASNAEIASLLGITVPTVKTHVAHVFDKMGADSRMAVSARLNAF